MLAEATKIKLKRREEHQSVRHGPMTDLQQDMKLVQRIAARDEEALKDLYSTYGQRLYAYALRLTQDPDQAEDVVQDVLVSVWQSAHKYRGEGRLIAWLLGIVHHTAIKSLRRNSVPISDEMEEMLHAKVPLPEEQIHAIEKANWLRLGIRSLSAEHRAVLDLVFYQDLSLKEAADVCGCPVGTVKSRLSYARQKLRGVLSRLEESR